MYISYTVYNYQFQILKLVQFSPMSLCLCDFSIYK